MHQSRNSRERQANGVNNETQAWQIRRSGVDTRPMDQFYCPNRGFQASILVPNPFATSLVLETLDLYADELPGYWDAPVFLALEPFTRCNET